LWNATYPDKDARMQPRRLEGRIFKAVNRANRDFGLIGEGDRILLAMSGGKDSFGLYWALRKLQAAAAYDFDLVLYHLNQGQPGHDTGPIEAFMRNTALPFEIEFQDTYSRVVELVEPGRIYCSLCSRFRRAIIYKAATRHACNKVALGHHRDDLVETVLMSMFYNGQIKSMPPKLISDDGKHQVIRPLAYVPEAELQQLARQQEFPIQPCRVCGSQQAERHFVKTLLKDLAKHERRISNNILASLGRVVTTHLMDSRLNPLYPQKVAPTEPPTERAEPLPIVGRAQDVL
jgi:tRNA 2-thiocytidine biosynthesis protein TtcA